MKKAFKALVTSVLGWQVRRLRRKNKFQVIAVVGSVGKTSTKLAIARLLSEHYKVRHQEGNYNDIVSVPMVFFGSELPSLLNPLAWLKNFFSNELQIMRPYPYGQVVLELGTDGPGQLVKFKKYIKIDLLVVTSLAPEHMEFFKTLDSVAKEELLPQSFSKAVLINKDLCPERYAPLFKHGHLTYGIKSAADYNLKVSRFDGQEFEFSIYNHSEFLLDAQYRGVSEVELYSVCAAVAVGERMNVPTGKMKSAISKLTAFSGRMQQLPGINQSLIIDDTYNASPEATKAALDTLYSLKTPQKIALLGNMNELGSYSQAAHTEIGEYCDPKELNLVVTIGRDANRYLAPAAEKRGCAVKTFDNPYSAGIFIKSAIKPKAIILAKGSQNGVYAEEAIKYFLANPKDEKLLVRQSPQWLHKKKKSFQSAGSAR
jgi:UDP-N-acetylmuramoyl-tripeptide--D-alanyl-D-alanine ligase